METHLRKRLDIIVEAPLQRRVTEVLEAKGVRGYTVLRCLAGKGHGGVWQEGEISSAGAMRMIVSIMPETQARQVLEELQSLLGDYAAIATLSDVEVLRGDHF